MLRLNIGCGNDYKQGYCNIDITTKYCSNGVDLIADMRYLDKHFQDNSVDEICAEGCIEHLSYREVIQTFIIWHRLLKPGGFIIIETPNLLRICKDILEVEGNWGHAYETLFGGQRNPTEFHKALWSEKTLANILLMCNFNVIRKLKPINNLESGEDWNIRLKAEKCGWYDNVS